ncbi:hypothetical protein PS720_04206 [Pseudomonas fluorescens]|nr:hypothetical protein PS720_04206 [Pseudomonas fluorescens]
MGSALTAGHFWKSAKSNPKRFAPTLGTSPRLGVPVIRQGFGGPPEIKSQSAAALEPTGFLLLISVKCGSEQAHSHTWLLIHQLKIGGD